MNTTHLSASTPATTSPACEVGVCGHCHQSNAADAKFCGGCGQPLWEACGRCQQQVPIGQRFCAGCGHRLSEQLQHSLQQISQTLDDAQRALEALQFERAMALARPYAKARDYRFDALAARSAAIVQQAQQAAAEWQQRIAAAEQQARTAAEQHDHVVVATALQKIPPALLSGELQTLLDTATSTVAELRRLHAETRQALVRNEWVSAGLLLEQLLQLRPGATQYLKNAELVADQLGREAQQHYAAGRVSRAVQCLQAVPLTQQSTPSYQQLRRQVDAMAWMIEQISHEPLMTPALLGICKRLADLVPHDRRTAQLVQRVGELRKARASDPRCPYPAWNAPPVAWRSAPLAVLAQPQRVTPDDRGVMQKHRGRFCLALGLALQGCGEALVDLSLGSVARAGKLNKLFRRKPVEACWGVDCGSTGIRAVLLRRDGESWAVERAWQAEYPQPLCRASAELTASQCRTEALQDFVAQCQPGDTPVWVNLPGRDIITRFVQLPPLDEARLAPLLEKEAAAHLPRTGTELIVRSWVGAAHAGDSTGRAAVIVAAKESTVQQTLQMCAEVNLRPAGIQCEPVALGNFLAHEFQTTLTAADPSGGVPAVALVDSGAQATTVVALTQRSLWFRTFDGGGEDLTAKIANQLQITATAAEAIKRDLPQADDPAAAWSAIEPPLQAMGARIDAAYGQSPLASERVSLQGVYAVGGNWQTVGWLRHVLCRA